MFAEGEALVMNSDLDKSFYVQFYTVSFLSCVFL